VRPGAVLAESVSRRFRLNPERHMTLKEALLRRGQSRAQEIWALRDVSFAIERGEAVGLVGRNGSGKTTLLRLIAGIFRPTEGQLSVGGSIGSLLELGAGFHPDFTGRDNVFMNGAIHGLKRRYIRERMDEIVAFAELERFIDSPVRTYSAGMYMRLGFSVATHLDPDVLLLDEVFAVGDEAFQRKCFGKIFDLRDAGKTILFVSHSAPAVERLCERAILLQRGRVVADGVTRDVVAEYQRLLAMEESPAERGAGLREWGSGDARVSRIRLAGADGVERREFLSGEPLVVRLAVEVERAVPPPRIAVEFRDANGGLLGANEADAGTLGWNGGPGRFDIDFEIQRLPFVQGLFRLSVGLADPSSLRQYHRLDPAAEFTVFPADEDTRGWFRFDGEWSTVNDPMAVKAP
jgi:ABC-type polysaccharide/polyol phosphate transport system ATPase subunit